MPTFFFFSYFIVFFPQNLKTISKCMVLLLSVAVTILIVWEHSVTVSAGVAPLKPVELLLLFIIASAEQLRLCKTQTNCHLGVCQERTGTMQPIHLSQST